MADEWEWSDDQPEVTVTLQWDGLEITTSGPIAHLERILGTTGNELLRLNAALLAQGESSTQAESFENDEA